MAPFFTLSVDVLRVLFSFIFFELEKIAAHALHCNAVSFHFHIWKVGIPENQTAACFIQFELGAPMAPMVHSPEALCM